MISKFLENPLLSLLTVITTALTTINTFSSTVGISPFWADIFISIILAYTTIFWCIRLWKDSKKTSIRIGILNQSDNNIPPYRQLLKSFGIAILFPVILLGLLAHNIILPFTHLMAPQWSLCATFVTNCNSNVRLQFFDARKRPISDDRYRLDDDTGYKYLDAPRWWTYKPGFVDIDCKGSVEEKISLKEAIFNKSCTEVVELR